MGQERLVANSTHEAGRGIGIGDGLRAPFAVVEPKPLPRSGPSWPVLCALAVVAVITVAAAVTAVLAPGLRPLLLQEDGIVETASAAFFAVAVLGAAAGMVRYGVSAPRLLAGHVGFAELMDETSFGSRLFGFEPPPLYGGGQLDGFHDLLILAYRLLRDTSQDLAWLWVGLILAVSIAMLILALRLVAKGFTGGATRLSGHTLLFVHFALIGLAQVIDIATSSHILSAMEEVFELDAGIVLVFYVMQQAGVLRAANTA
jgi:hypothetical protein